MDPFEELLARSEPPVPELARRLRRLVLEVLPPSTVETVEGGDAGYGTGSGYTGLVCVIAPHRRHVNLGLADGAALPDPHGLLQGTGRRHRHVRIASEADLAHPGVRALLEAAAARVGGSSS